MKIEFYWTNLIGLARTLLAIGTLLTIIFNPIDILINTAIIDSLGSWQNFNIFFLFDDNLIIAKIISILVLVSVITGYFQQVTGILHWYITYSFFSASSLIDGGDHVSSILTFLIIPITLTDRRLNHWKENNYEYNSVRSLIAKIFLTLIKIQVCAIYFHAFVGKIPIDEWHNGIATYYWLTHEYFGINKIIRPIYKFFLSNAFVVSLITWGTLVFEFLLSSAIFINNKKTKIYLLLFGLLFHFTILITHGLVSFFFAMSAALVLYLLPNELNLINLKNIFKNVKRNNFNFSI